VIEFNQDIIRAPGFSAGLVVCESSEDAESLLKRVDELLYSAKEKGRNRIEVEKTGTDVDMAYKKK